MQVVEFYTFAEGELALAKKKTVRVKKTTTPGLPKWSPTLVLPGPEDD